ncbi:TVP38/TMEM64 family protein [Haloarchaeobius baliensis]|uniref:TVP38/TMEM64 family protein n=1 Tax=Haloarchaeobius baliensis TaxID=1670458 RepID=UPI003F883238
MRSSLDRMRTGLSELQVFESRESRRRFAVHLLLLAVGAAVAWVFIRRNLAFLTNTRELRRFIRSYGILAPVVLIGLQALQVVLAPIPGQVLAVVAGYLFGAWWGTLYNMIGIVIGSTVAFWLARRFGRSYVENIVHEGALARFDSISEDYAIPALFLLFLIPGLPDDVICFAGGLTDVPLWQLVAIALIGRAPAFFLINVFGTLLEAERFGAAFGVAVLLMLFTLLGYRYRDRLVHLFDAQ